MTRENCQGMGEMMNEPKKFRTKSVEIEAIEFTGENAREIATWIGEGVVLESDSKGFMNRVVIQTLEGDMTAVVGDWVIKGVQGKFYPYKPSIFAETYDEVL